MAFFSATGIMATIVGFFKNFNWKKWAVLLIVLVIAGTLWYYRAEVQELTDKLNDANREIATLEEELKAERFMKNLDTILIDDYTDQSEALAASISDDRKEYAADLDEIRRRIRDQVRTEFEKQTGSSDAIECRRQEATRESVDRAVIERISERMFRVYTRSQGDRDGAIGQTPSELRDRSAAEEGDAGAGEQ